MSYPKYAMSSKVDSFHAFQPMVGFC